MSVTSTRSAGTKRRAVHGGSADKEPGARRALAPRPAPVTQIDVGAVRLITARERPVEHDIEMTVVVDVGNGERLKLAARGVKVHGPSDEASSPVAIINIDAPALKRGDHVRM